MMTVSSLQTTTSMFGLAAFDESEDIARLFGLNITEPQTQVVIAQLIEKLITTLSPECSGIVMDPRLDLSLLQYKHAPTGVCFRLAETAPTPEPQLPRLFPNWGIEAVRNNFGAAFLQLPYNPMEALALDKKKFVYEVSDFCRYEGVTFVLDIKLTGVNGGKIHPDDISEAQIQAVQELQRLAQVLVLDYPGSVLSTATLTAELDVPWLLTDRDQSYDLFKTHVREVLENGAHGFMIGKALWQEVSTLRQKDMTPDFAQIDTFIQTTTRDRLIELMRIVNEAADKASEALM